MQTMETGTKVDAIELLVSEHREAKDLFKKYEQAKEKGDTTEKYDIAKQVCGALLIHMQIEESIFYPAVRKELDEEEMMNEAIVEHSGAKDLIRQLGEMKPEDPMFDAKVKVLSEQIDHHVEEEEDEMFPESRKSDADMLALGEQLLAAKNKLRTQHGLPPVE